MARKKKANTINKAQSVLEYTLLLAAVIAVIVIGLLGSGGVKDKITGTYNKTSEALNKTAYNATFGVFQ